MSKNNFERRTVSEAVEFRDNEAGGVTAYGYAARFDARSQNLGGFVERIAPGAFKQTLQEADVRGLFNHDPNYVLGRNRAGTLRMHEDDVGLAYEIDLPNTSAGRDVAELLRRGDVSGSSFGFRMIDEEWGETDSGFPERTVKVAALRDVGPVTFPAYTAAESALRSLAEVRGLPLERLVAAGEADELQEVLFERADDGAAVEEPAENDVTEDDVADEGRANPAINCK